MMVLCAQCQVDYLLLSIQLATDEFLRSSCRYSILARDIFNQNYALFIAAADGATFQPNPVSDVNSDHLAYFKFVGRIVGKAIADGQALDAHFTQSFYKVHYYFVAICL